MCLGHSGYSPCCFSPSPWLNTTTTNLVCTQQALRSVGTFRPRCFPRYAPPAGSLYLWSTHNPAVSLLPIDATHPIPRQAGGGDVQRSLFSLECSQSGGSWRSRRAERQLGGYKCRYKIPTRHTTQLRTTRHSEVKTYRLY